MSYLQRVCAVVAAWQLCACGRIIDIEDLPAVPPDASPPADAAPVYTVKGTAVGLLEPMSLRLEHPGGFELLRVEEDGTFAFAAELADGAIYSVTFVGEPPCVLADATGVVAGTIRLVSLACESVLLSGLALSGPAAPALDFTPAQRTYEAEVSLLQQTVQVTATAARPDAVLTVNGAPVTSGVPTEPFTLALGENPIEIAVANARGAQRVYRVTVSRAAQVAQYVYGKASNTGTGDGFGTSVALWGDTLVVGAPREDSGAQGVNGDQNDDSRQNSGAVYVFRRYGSSWTQESYLKASNPDEGNPFGDSFGSSLAIWDDILVVGAPDEDSGASGVGGDQADNSVQDSGAVYVFRREGTSWVQEAYVKASNPETFDRFGTRVTLWDGVLAVGATGEDSGSPGVNGDQSDNSIKDSGAVYVFRRDGTFWRQEAYLKASNPGSYHDPFLPIGDQFGISLALWGDTLAVGAYNESSSATGTDGNQDDDSTEFSGAVYIFRRTDAGWVQEAYVKASNTGAGDQFGFPVSLWGDRLAVGARFEDSSAVGVGGGQDDDDAENSGAVYLFRRSGMSWAQEAYIKASNTDAGDRFGGDVALHGEVLAVGAGFEGSSAIGVDGDQSDDSLSGSGAVYVFTRSNGSWTQKTYLKASNPDGAYDGELSGDSFGLETALWESSLVVAAPSEDSNATGVNRGENDNSAAASGAVYIFH